MFKKLDDVLKRYDYLTSQLSSPAVISDMEQWTKFSKERSELEEVALKYSEYKRVEKEMNDASEMSALETDPEMKEMLGEEVYECKDKLARLREELKILLLPKDKNDSRNCILEIRAGVGGEEAALFAAELFRMYQGYCDKHRLKYRIEEENRTELGGIKEISVNISGKDAYKQLKYESGVHRVQRVPETETSGRIHTSAVSVAVMPEAEEVDVKIDEKDIRIDIYHSGGAGGQNVNKVASAVRITHFPSGIVVQCQNERSQLQNKEMAFKILRAKLYDYYNSKNQSEYDANRKSLIGSGDRSAKIRTYNFPQGRITDHRIGYNIFSMESFMAGNIDEMIEALTLADREALLAGRPDDE